MLNWEKPEEIDRDFVLAINLNGGLMKGWLADGELQHEFGKCKTSIIQAVVKVRDVERDFESWKQQQ